MSAVGQLVVVLVALDLLAVALFEVVRRVHERVLDARPAFAEQRAVRGVDQPRAGGRGGVPHDPGAETGDVDAIVAVALDVAHGGEEDLGAADRHVCARAAGFILLEIKSK